MVKLPGILLAPLGGVLALLAVGEPAAAGPASLAAARGGLHVSLDDGQSWLLLGPSSGFPPARLPPPPAAPSSPAPLPRPPAAWFVALQAGPGAPAELWPIAAGP